MDLASIIIRFHHKGNIEFLKDALLSVFTQDYKKIEIILCGQRLDPNEILTINKYVNDLQVINPRISFSLKNLKIKRPKDLRTHLLNLGLKVARGKYISFLDYDDILYPNCIHDLIANLVSSKDVGVSVGPCRKVKVDVMDLPAPYVVTKSPFNLVPRNYYDQFFDNYIPIHSFVFDKTKFPKSALKFDTGFEVLEDYAFLLTLMSYTKFKFLPDSNFICEYRLRNDSSNSNPLDTENHPLNDKWARSREKIKLTKAKLFPKINIQEIVDIFSNNIFNR